MDGTRLTISRRQPKNLKQYLTRAKFSSGENTTPAVTKCNEQRCGTREHIYTGESVTFKNGKVWKVKSSISCKSRNVIYAILCTKCESFYVGQTENLRNRVTVHKGQIKHDEYGHLNVSKHLKSCTNGKFKIFPIYNCHGANRLIREAKEKEVIGI